MSRLTDHLLLSLLWLVGCLPIVTAPVATAALFDVARRESCADGPPLTRSFVTAFRRYVGPAMLVGIGWAAVGAFLALDLMIAARMDGPGRDALLVALLVLAFLYALVSAALFPVLVSFDGGPRELLRTAALVAVVSPGRGLLALAIMTAAAAAVWTVPISVLAAPSLVATALQRLYQGAFARLRQHAQPPYLTALAMPSSKENSR